MNPENEETNPRPSVLLAAVGMSPAVLTETVWALAHEDPPEIPEKVIVLTTASGRNKLVTELLSANSAFDGLSPWQALRKALADEGLPVDGKLRFGSTAEDIRVFTTSDGTSGESIELEDIRTAKENEAVADFTLEVVRAGTTNPDTRLIASIAGGRKTMSAVLYACMSLLGRDDDRLNHVLLNSPFDDARLDPPFYFPSQPATSLRLPNGHVFDSSDARIDLAELLFVPLRNLFASELGEIPGGFSSMVRKYSKGMRRKAIENLTLFVSFSQRVAGVCGKEISVNSRAAIALILLARRAKAGLRACDYQSAVESVPALVNELRENAATSDEGGDWILHFNGDEMEAADLSKGVSDLRAAFRSLGGDHSQIAQALPKGKFLLDLDPSQIIFTP